MVGRRLYGGQLPAAIGLKKQKAYRCCLKVWGMGHHNAVDVAQRTHQELLRAEGALHEAHVMELGRLPPASDTWEGVYIDDRLVCQQIAIRDLKRLDVGLDAELVAKSTRAYSKEKGLTRADEKS